MRYLGNLLLATTSCPSVWSVCEVCVSLSPISKGSLPPGSMEYVPKTGPTSNARSVVSAIVTGGRLNATGGVFLTDKTKKRFSELLSNLAAIHTRATRRRRQTNSVAYHSSWCVIPAGAAGALRRGRGPGRTTRRSSPRLLLQCSSVEPRKQMLVKRRGEGTGRRRR